ncbi:MAG: helix-turn-helix transcriptional regulator [Ruminococcaceae bacterium]|nr:helix-turn-helix transcriptional regulator [Oscillospiraceae bacterium]
MERQVSFVYNDGGYGRYAMKNIINCHNVKWEKFCENRDNYTQIFYNMVLTLDFFKNAAAEICVNGKRYVADGNILAIRKDNIFSHMKLTEEYDEWYMISSFFDIVRKIDSDYTAVAEKIHKLADEKTIVLISDEDADVLKNMFVSLSSIPIDSRKERDLRNREILQFIVNCLENGETVDGSEWQLETEKMHKVIDYIRENITSKLTVDEIADACYFDKYHLSKMFKRYTDHTINQFVTVYRIVRSVEYLYEGYSVEEAGKMCGFKNADTYIKAFKQINHNTTPKQFIKREI